MDPGIFHHKILALPEAISLLTQEGTVRVVVTVHKRFLTSLTTTNLQIWWARYTVFHADLELRGAIWMYFLIALVSPAS